MKKEETDFDSQFPTIKFTKSKQWTSQDSLRDKVMAAMERCLKNNPTLGIVKFEKLPDGSYEIKSYKSDE